MLTESGKPGEGQLWNLLTKCWEEPTLEEKEQLMGYNIGDTAGGHATIPQRASRLGQAMDGNTMRWLGAFLYAQQQRIDTNVVPTGIKTSTGFTHHHNRISNYFKKDVAPKLDNNKDVDPHYQACAVIEKILQSEVRAPCRAV